MNRTTRGQSTTDADAFGSTTELRSDGVQIHPTAIIEEAVQIGSGTAIWDNVHVRRSAFIGHDCIIGEKTYVAYGVHIGNYVKINAQVYLCTGVTIEDRVMVAAGVVFTNERSPRAFSDDRPGLATSTPTDETLTTVVRTGATLGAGAVIGPGIDIGAYAMVGMGTVVTATVPSHGLFYGNPGRLHGFACVCGKALLNVAHDLGGVSSTKALACERCGRRFRLSEGAHGISCTSEAA